MERPPFRTCKCEHIYCAHYPEPKEGRHWFAPFIRWIPWAIAALVVYGWGRTIFERGKEVKQEEQIPESDRTEEKPEKRIFVMRTPEGRLQGKIASGKRSRPLGRNPWGFFFS